jgi:hypothetical protein
MTLPDFVAGVRCLPRIVAEEKLLETTVATAGGMVDEKYIKSIYKHFEQMTRDPEKVALARKVQEKWAARGVRIEV